MAKKYENIGDTREQPELLKKKSFNPFNFIYTREGKGVGRDEDNLIEKPNLKNFFKLFWRRFNHVFGVNLLLVIGNFPILFALFALAYSMGESYAPSRQIFSALEAVSRIDNSPVVSSLLGIYGGLDSVAVMTTATYILLGLTALVFITFGPVSAGTAYVLRNSVKGEPVFVWSDFAYAVKRNWKQALVYGIIDILMMVMFVYVILFYRLNINTNIGMFMFVISSGMSIFYFFMRMYIYPMMVTFDMSVMKLIKNSMLFAILGIKRNIMVLFGVIAIVVFELLLMTVVPPVAIMLPFLIIFGLIGFMCMYAAYPKIKEIMIDPYYNEVEGGAEE
ncbi:MAG: DUF624 domain-containing protein [Clostridia bacterium]|nr:DUF624 domain-containing protein [Clostridia bacterium]